MDSERHSFETQAYREGQETAEREAFMRKHKDAVERNLPQAEFFVFDFANKVLKPLTEEEKNPLRDQLELTDEELDLLKMANDAFKLAKADRLIHHAETNDVSGYSVDEGTRSFSTNMIFLGFRGQSGRGFMDAVDDVTDFLGDALVSNAEARMAGPDYDLTFVIDEDGKTFTKEKPASSEPRLHSEGEEEDSDSYTFSLMLGWDIDNNLPVFVSIWGNKGLLGKTQNIKFSFESDSPGTNTFPLNHEKKTPEIKRDDNVVEMSVTDPAYTYREKHVKVGQIDSHGDEKLTVWGNKGSWNDFQWTNRDN